MKRETVCAASQFISMDSRHKIYTQNRAINNHDLYSENGAGASLCSTLQSWLGESGTGRYFWALWCCEKKAVLELVFSWMVLKVICRWITALIHLVKWVCKKGQYYLLSLIHPDVRSCTKLFAAVSRTKIVMGDI